MRGYYAQWGIRMNEVGNVALGALLTAIVVAIIAYIRGRAEARADRDDRVHEMVLGGRSTPGGGEIAQFLGSLTAQLTATTTTLADVREKLAGLDAHVRATLVGLDGRVTALEARNFATSADIARAVEAVVAQRRG